jgi:hypothetical protein
VWPCHAVLLFLICEGSVCAQQLVRDIDWTEMEKSGVLAAGEVVAEASEDSGGLLRVEHGEAEPATLHLFTLEPPEISRVHYAVTGRVRYTDVAAGSYLEMWNHFSNGGFYFSRTLGDSGPMQKLEGTSDWREFTLPFFGSQEVGAPTKLVVNLVLMGKGTVELSPLRVVEFDDARQLSVAGQPSGWWTVRGGALFGGIAGSVFGLLGALVGTLAGCGRARRFVMSLLVLMVAVGCVSLGIGLVAVVCRQPYHVFFPLLLLGILLPAVTGPLLLTLPRRYQQHELRRMSAMDVAGAGNSL